MAESQISLRERKARLLMESDTLRYHIGLQCSELAVPTEVFLQGFRVAHIGSRIYAATAPLRNRKRSKLLSVPAVIWRLMRG